MNIQDRIRAGEFASKVEYPERVEVPLILRTPVLELSEEMLVKEVPRMAAEYQAAREKHAEQRKLYNESVHDGETRFQHALAEEYGMVDHPKSALLFGKAWEMGHSGGHEEVAGIYADLVELVK